MSKEVYAVTGNSIEKTEVKKDTKSQLEFFQEQAIFADRLRGWTVRLLNILAEDKIKITATTPEAFKEYVDVYNRIVDIIGQSNIKKINVNPSVTQSAFSKEAMEKKQHEMYGIFKTKKEKQHTIENYLEELKLNEVEKKLIIDILVLVNKSLKTNLNSTSINNILDDNSTIKEFIDSKVKLLKDASSNEQTRSKK